MRGFSWSTVVLCPGLDSPVQERHRCTKDHQGVEGPGPALLRGQAERAWTVQPEEETFQGSFHQCI